MPRGVKSTPAMPDGLSGFAAKVILGEAVLEAVKASGLLKTTKRKWTRKTTAAAPVAKPKQRSKRRAKQAKPTPSESE